MSWKELEESIEQTKNAINQFQPTHAFAGALDEVSKEIVAAISDLQIKCGSCVGRALVQFPENARTLNQIEKEAADQFNILYGVERRNWRNYLSIVNVGLQKVARIKEYVKELEKEIIPAPHESIPPEVSKDYIESYKCYSVDAHNASVVMARRAIETAANELGANPTDRLVKKINYLRRTGRLEQSIAELATEIRLFGNIGAHPDLIRNISSEECEQILDFLDSLLNSVYVRPAEIENIRRRRQ